MDCIFCKIIRGEIPSYTIYEDEHVKAFLDIQPLSNGHTLIIPKKHFENLYDMDSENLKCIELASQKVAKLLKETLDCQGITRFQNNEYGQEVKHYHMHLIPRYKNKMFKVQVDGKEKLEVEEIFRKVQKSVS